MQASQPTENKNNKVKDDESINFRPSPNFKHMKKYLKSKFEEEASNTSPTNNQTTEASVSQISMMDEKEEAKTVEVHPPLPPNPPPPDNPLCMEVKKEIEDDDYNNNPEVSDSTQTEHVKDEQKNGDGNKPDKIMCRQFVRGICTRGSSCIFVHELILSQLFGVYTFCKNFQNSVCTYQKCKFVHATVFEKEYFFRTGYLPPHALAHLKENTTPQPPLPPPEGAQPPAQPIFINPPPTILTSSLPTSVSLINCTPTSNIENKNSDLGTSSNAFSLKRDWKAMDDLCIIIYKIIMLRVRRHPVVTTTRAIILVQECSLFSCFGTGFFAKSHPVWNRFQKIGRNVIAEEDPGSLRAHRERSVTAVSLHADFTRLRQTAGTRVSDQSIRNRLYENQRLCRTRIVQIPLFAKKYLDWNMNDCYCVLSVSHQCGEEKVIDFQTHANNTTLYNEDSYTGFDSESRIIQKIKKPKYIY